MVDATSLPWLVMYLTMLPTMQAVHLAAQQQCRLCASLSMRPYGGLDAAAIVGAPKAETNSLDASCSLNFLNCLGITSYNARQAPKCTRYHCMCLIGPDLGSVQDVHVHAYAYARLAQLRISI